MAISAINLGSFYTNSSGNSVSSGLSSGLNTDSLIKALTASQDAQVTKLQDQVTVNSTQVTALGSLSQILTSLQSAITPIGNPNSPDTTNNLFAVRASDITSNTSQTAANYLTATVASGTATGSYNISDISQLATKTVQETNAYTLASATDSVVPASPTPGFFSAGTITVNNKQITISEGNSLSDIAQAFNDVASDTGISASVLQTAAGKYKLIFSSTTTGEASRFDFTTPGTVSSDPSGVLSNVTFTPDLQGNDAKFKLNNVQIQRSTNNISDLISGVTFNLLQDTTNSPGANFTLQVKPDVDNITTGITNFATAYNNFLYFYSQQTQIDSTTGTPAKTATLYSDSVLQTIYSSVTSTAASLVKGLADGQPSSLASIGITFTDFAGDSATPATSNILSVDSSTLKGLLTTNFSGVENVLGDSMTASSSKLALYKSPTNTTITDFTLNINHTSSLYTATYTDANSLTHTVNLTATAVNGGGLSLAGPDDSVFAGMTLLYADTSDASGVDVTISQGLLSNMQTQLKAYLKTSTGSIAQDKSAISDKNTSLQKQITQVQTQTDTMRQSLLTKYSALEAAITKANSVLNLLNAQQLASSSN